MRGAAVLPKSAVGRPEPVDRQGVQPVLVCVGRRASVESEAGDELVAHGVTQLLEATEGVTGTRVAALTSNATTAPSSRSTTTSTSSPSYVRQCPTPLMPSSQDATFMISPTANVSKRCPNSVSEVGSRRGSFSGVRRRVPF